MVSVNQHNNVKALLKAIDEQFVTSDKALHIMQRRDIAAQLKTLEVEMSDSFLVHFILNILPQQYGPFKISYNTHKDKWSINELLTMCVQEEGRLKMELAFLSPKQSRIEESSLESLSKSRIQGVWDPAHSTRTGFLFHPGRNCTRLRHCTPLPPLSTRMYHIRNSAHDAGWERMAFQTSPDTHIRIRLAPTRMGEQPFCTSAAVFS
ncbi:hypothetical protein CK203_052353 [Vitis vinifera]|uniref:Uncharacterized protein n=1 Tax=Vitis vinifera TaxID=29760 RepID=A0A438H3X2_VITVI|nr:hypothetical protein CK203_052353 [Vitis vinifera]